MTGNEEHLRQTILKAGLEWVGIQSGSLILANDPKHRSTLAFKIRPDFSLEKVLVHRDEKRKEFAQ